MLRYLFRRLLYTIPTLWVMVTLIFLLSRVLPGTFGQEQISQAGEGFYSKGSQQQRNAAHEQLLARTNQHLPLFYVTFAPLATSQATSNYSYLLPDLTWNGTKNQYHIWAAALFTGSLGESFASSRPVLEILWEAAGNTIWLLLISMALTIVLALLISVSIVQDRAVKRRRVLLSFLILLDSFPVFLTGLLLLLLLANPDALQLFPVFGLGYHHAGEQSGFMSFIVNLPHLVLPIICLVLAELPYLTNHLYTSLKGTLQADYIRTARAKGLPQNQVIVKHALRNALLPVITVLSDMLPALVAGTVVIETIFAIPGVGRLLVTSVLARDFPVIVGIVVIIAIAKMLSHIVADILYALADPRIRHNQK
ncbi:ABC transporter permease [Pontibacter fetidus]|uniref:ABC transporter permease n=1 Tax=Pontibacter fetidus TaxID=2700082 RepID=A0A6B2H7Q7_9BACT|nr:ABC transporter permease [Pontibacter fetidus]NDK55990.1 ABC transporter permease [Pontibacter fetidus]